MSNSFVGSPCRAFEQSPCRARVSGGGKFIWQFLSCLVYAHNSDGSPWGEIDPFHNPGQDPNQIWPNAIDAGPFISQSPGEGATEEFWTPKFLQPFPPRNPVLVRSSLTNHPPAIKLLPPDHGWRTSSEFWRKLIAYRYNVNYLPFTAPIGLSYPGGQFEERVDRFKIYPTVSGTVTYHSLPFPGPGLIYTDAGIPFGSYSFTIPAPIRFATFDAGMPATEYFPDKPKTFERDFDSITFPLGIQGTLELALFWFERGIADLPVFPYLMSPLASVV